MNGRTLTAILVGCACLLAPLGCGGGGGGGALAVIIGRVVDDGSQEPIANATATVGSASALTGSNGRFTINGAPTGSQMLTITAAGHDSSNLPLTVSSGQNDVGTIYMAPTLNLGCGAVTGRLLLASDNSPISGGTIQSATASAVSRSDGSGRFTLYNVPAGSVQINFYDPVTTASTIRFNVTVSSGHTTNIGDVLVSFGPPPPPL